MKHPPRRSLLSRRLRRALRAFSTDEWDEWVDVSGMGHAESLPTSRRQDRQAAKDRAERTIGFERKPLSR